MAVFESMLTVELGLLLWKLFAVLLGLGKYGLQAMAGLLSVFANTALLDIATLL